MSLSTFEFFSCDILNDNTITLLNEFNNNQDVLKIDNKVIKKEVICKDVKLINNVLEKNVRNFELEKIGILCESLYEIIISILSLKANNINYVIINPNKLIEEIKNEINEKLISTILTNHKYIQLLNNLQWEIPSFNLYICLDEEEVFQIEDTFNTDMMNPSLWDYISRKSNNPIEGGGWYSSFTGKPLTNSDIEDYLQNTKSKLSSSLNKSANVLEIGCASGLTMVEIAPLVKNYDAIDISKSMVEKSKQLASSHGVTNVCVEKLAAHDLSLLQRRAYDIIILNSVCQYFPGHNYFKKVLAQCIDKCEDMAVIYFGDIMNLESKSELIQALNEFKKNSIQNNNHTKLNFDKELFLTKDFFKDLINENSSIESMEIFDRESGITNELNMYRFDVMLKINKQHKEPKAKKKKGQIGIRLSLKG